jgi:UDP-N-acetylmuramoyl-L-alanyl-D-glutamate--2,6-diaminopimelate ligase
VRGSRPRGGPLTFPAPPPWSSEIFTIGVTGTNGKTTTTAFVAAALGAEELPVVRLTTVGSFLGTEPLDVPETHAGFLEAMRRCRARGGDRAAIELTSEALAAGFARTWPCSIGVLTNVTHDHLDRHGTPEHYLASKAQLFVSLPAGGAAVLNAADPASDLIAEVLPPGVRLVRYGVAARARGEPDLAASRVVTDWDGTRIELCGELAGGSATLAVRAPGEPFAENALAALAAAVAAGVPAPLAAARIARFPPPPGRFERVASRPFVVVDFAHTPDALRRTLETARALCAGSVAVVFGAGGQRDRSKRRWLGVAAAAADRVVVTSDNPRDEDPAAIAAEVVAGLAAHRAVSVELDRQRAIERAIRDADPDDVVVIAGKGHEEVQIVGGSRRPFSDRLVAVAAHRARGAS